MEHEKKPLPLSPALTNLLALTEEGLGQLVEPFGWPRYRTGQTLRWLYQRRAHSIAQMTDLSRKDREQLAKIATIQRTEDCTVLESTDGTRKLLLTLDDGLCIVKRSSAATADAGPYFNAIK